MLQVFADKPFTISGTVLTRNNHNCLLFSLFVRYTIDRYLALLLTAVIMSNNAFSNF